MLKIIAFAILALSACVGSVSDSERRQSETCIDCFLGDDGGNAVILESQSTPEHAVYQVGDDVVTAIWDNCEINYGITTCKLLIRIAPNAACKFKCQWDANTPYHQCTSDCSTMY